MAAPVAETGTNSSKLYTHQLPNGLQLVGQRMPDLESISLCYHVRTGSRDEHEYGLYGVSHFLEHMVFKGTSRRDAEQITLDFNLMGAEFNAFTSTEQTVFYARVLGEYLEPAVDLLSDMMRPRLDEQDFSLERNVILEEIARSKDVPTNQAYRKLLTTYFAGNSLGHEVLGTTRSIREMSVEQMRGYWKRRYTPNNMVFSIAGNFDWDRVVALVEKAAGSWLEGESGRDAEPFVPAEGATRVIVKPQQKQQIILLATPSLGMEDSDIYAAELATTILGDSTGSRLFWNIFQQGLAETAAASLLPHDRTGLMVTFISTTPDHAPTVLELLRNELRSMQENGIAEDELRRAKDKLISRTVLDGDSAYSRMQDLVYTWLTERRLRTIEEEMQEIERVTPDDIRRVLDRFPLTHHQVVTTYGPLDARALSLTPTVSEDAEEE